ncbi:MAG: NAD-dependent epimerase/dehydratase family protein [Chloroflexi bacterium]|nr:NAD-dependent epimerase/dehydratase family protein [Chloroflexota bacterium]
MKVVITGGAGLIARYTALRLVDEGHEVVLFDRYPLRETGPDDRLPKLRFHLGDILDEETCVRACDGAEGIVHLAGIKTPQEPGCFAINTVGTWNVLEAARTVGARRVVLASSVNALGIGWHLTTKPLELVDYVPFDEAHPVHPEDAYSLAKYFNELTAAGFTQASGLETAAMRYAGVLPPERMQALAARPPEPAFVRGPSGYQGIWGYVDVRDVAQANCRALLAPDLPPTGAYYIAAEDTTSPVETMELLRRFLPHWVPKARGITGRQSLFNCDRAKKAFGYQPEYSWTQYR